MIKNLFLICFFSFQTLVFSAETQVSVSAQIAGDIGVRVEKSVGFGTFTTTGDGGTIRINPDGSVEVVGNDGDVQVSSGMASRGEVNLSAPGDGYNVTVTYSTTSVLQRSGGDETIEFNPVISKKTGSNTVDQVSSGSPLTLDNGSATLYIGGDLHVGGPSDSPVGQYTNSSGSSASPVTITVVY